MLVELEVVKILGGARPAPGAGENPGGGRVRGVSAGRLAAWAVAAVVLGAFALRLWRLYDHQNFVGTDDTVWLLGAMDPYHAILSPSWAALARALYRIAVFPYGPGYVLVNASWIGLMSILHVPLTEVVLVMPTVLMGTGSVALVFLIGRDLHSPAAGLLAALWTAILPLSVGLSRFPAGSPQPGSFFLLLAIWCVWRYARTGGTGRAWVASVPLTFYFLSDSLFPAALPLLAYLAVAAQKGETLRARWRLGLQRLAAWRLWLLPALAFLPLLATWVHRVTRGDPTAGIIGHLLSKKGAYIPGFHAAALESILYACGGALPLLGLAALIYGLWQAARLTAPGAAAIWTVVFLAPWFLLLDLTPLHRIYYLNGILGLLVLIGCAAVEAGRWLRARLTGAARIAALAGGGLLLIVATAVTAAATLFIVYDLRLPAAAVLPPWLSAYGCPYSTDSSRYRYYGSVCPDWGLKAAGVYLRQETPPGTVVLTEVGTTCGRYYFGRPMWNDEDLWTYSNSTPAAKFGKLAWMGGRVDMVVARAHNAEAAAAAMPPDFHLAAVVTVEAKPALMIWRKGPAPPAVRMLAAEDLNPVFDATYARLPDLIVQDWVYRAPIYN